MLRTCIIFSLALAACDAPPTAETEEALIGAGEDPSSLNGLGGSYLRLPILAPAGEMTSMTLTGQPIDGGFRYEGTYQRTLSGDGSERGKFGAVASNPAIGPLLVFNPDDPNRPDDGWAILKIWRSAWTGKITRIQLLRSETPVDFYRIGS